METAEDKLPDFIKLWNFSNPAETEQRFREILPRAQLSQDAEYLAQLLTQIARCEGLQSHFAECHATLDTVEKMLFEHDLKLAQVRYFLERGRAFNSAGQQGIAIPLFQKAYEVAEEQRHVRLSIDAVHMIAIAERDPNVQIEWNLKGIAMAESDPAGQSWLHALLNNIGESYLAARDFESAYKSFHWLGEIQTQSSGSPDIYTIKDEAKALRLSGRPVQSFALMHPILDALKAEKKDDGYIRQEIAEALYAIGKHEDAKPHFQIAFDLLSKDDWVIKNEADKLARLLELSK